MPPTNFPSMEPHRNGWAPRISPPPQPPRQRPNYYTHIMLFLMTIVTTVVAGMVWEGLNPLEQIREFHRGLPYAFTLLTILLFHEMGHYLTARYYGMDVTLPYFLPAPPPLPIGTFGAFIRMRSPARNRRALLHVGAAGPIAGFCVALPAMIYAYTTASVVPVAPSPDSLSFAEPLLLQFIGHAILGPIRAGYAIHLNGVGLAAWFGIFVTVLNLLPIGQLDGGHILYAIVGPYARYVSWAVVCLLLVLGFFFLGWFLWAVLGWLTSRRPQIVLDPYTPLDRRSLMIAGIALAIFVLCFMPIPITIGEMAGS
jgi:membrane-associated protease RseP (regulator of RpoE activity)